MSHFQPKYANISSKAYRILSSIFVARLHHSDSKTMQKVYKVHKNEDFEVFRIIWSNSEGFWSKTLQRFFQKNYCLSGSCVVDRVGTFYETARKLYKN